MESGRQPGNEIRQIYREYGISGNMAKYVKQEKNAGKTGKLMKPGNKNEIELMKNDAEPDEEDGGATRKKQNGSNGKAVKAEAKAKAKSENANSRSNTNSRRLDEMVQQCKILQMRMRAATAEPLNGKGMESGK